MQSISVPIFCVFDKCKPNLKKKKKKKKIELFIFIKSILDAGNLQNPIGFCIKLHKFSIGNSFFSNCFIKKNYKNIIKRYVITLNPYYLITTHSRRCKLMILMFSKAFYLIIILKIINQIIFSEG